MTKFRRVLGEVFEEIGVYLFTLIGIVLSQYAPMLIQSGEIRLGSQWLRLAVSAGMALYLVAKDESSGDKEGRAANLKKRLASAISSGYMWNGLVGLAGQVAGQ